VSHRPQEFAIDGNHALARGLVFAGLGRHIRSTRYTDSSLRKIDGTLTNMETATDWVWDQTLGRWCIDCDGTDEYVNCGTSSILNPTGGMSFGAWVNVSILTTEKWIIGRDQHAARSYSFGWSSSNKLYLQINGAATRVGTTILSASTWYHCAFRGNSAIGWEIYLNGKRNATAAAWVAPNATATATNIGRRSYVAYYGYWAGKIADALIANRAWSVAEIQQLADPGNVMLSGLVMPERRRVWAGVVAASSNVRAVHHHRQMMGAA